METHTIYLDEQDEQKSNLQGSKLFWAFQFALGIWIVSLAVTEHPDPEKNVLRMIALISVGLLVVTSVFLRIFLSPKRRPFIRFQEDGLIVKQSFFRKAQSVARDEISSVDLKSNAVEILLKDPNRGEIRIEPMSYVANQKVKERFQSYVSEK